MGKLGELNTPPDIYYCSTFIMLRQGEKSNDITVGNGREGFSIVIRFSENIFLRAA